MPIEITHFGDFIDISPKMAPFSPKWVILGKGGAPAGRGLKTSTKPIGFLGVLGCQSLIFGEIHVKW